MKTLLLVLLSLSLFTVPTYSAFALPGSIDVLDTTVNYDIENGDVIDAYVDVDFIELIIDFVSIADGTLEISVPRALLDAKSSATVDDIFFVIIDGFETEYVEIDTTATTRTILVPFFAGDQQMEIIGTSVFDIGLEDSAPTPTINIPDWVRNNAGWWSEGLIGDGDFVSGIQYLIQEGVMSIPTTEAGTSTGEPIPDWIKNNAGWWSEGLIGDGDFVSGIQYLITNGILSV